MEKNILFVCKHNVFRSKTAEAYFNKINKNKNLKADSVRLIKLDWFDKNNTKVIDSQRKALEKKEIYVKKGSKTLSAKLIRKQDLIIVISNNISDFFHDDYVKKNLEVRIWKIKDITSENYSGKSLIHTIDSIMKKVENLVKELK